MNGAFGADFAKLIAHPPRCLKSLKIVSPETPQGGTIEALRKVYLAWANVILPGFESISLGKEIRLDKLDLGSRDLRKITIPIPTMTSRPAKIILAELSHLTLSNVEHWIYFDFPLLSASRESTAALNWTDVLALTPKLKVLNYDGHGTHFPGAYTISRNLRQPPALRELILTHLDTRGTSLMLSLKMFSATLRRLTLIEFRLASGTWRQIFRFLRTELNLEFALFWGLYEPGKEVCLDAIIQDRPLAMDREDVKSNAWRWSKFPKEWGKDLEELLADNWVLVAHDTAGPRIVELNNEERDDAKEWLAELEYLHQLP